MRIARLRLRNFSCYRGDHTLDLEDKVYAVVARRVGDAESSNWAGKSTLLEAVDFALYGSHRFRTEDAWITRGEPSGEVEVTLDDGTRILRSRQRGKRTTLYFGADAIQDEAQAKVDATLGLSSEDFRATCYFEQRQMARMVLAKPEERMGIISAWLRLGPLEECEARARARAGELADGVARLQAVGEHLVVPDEVDDGELEKAAALVERRTGEVAGLQDAIEANGVLLSARSRIEDYERLVEDGKALREKVDAMGVDGLRKDAEKVDQIAKKAAARLANVSRARDERVKVARGEFDGRCPIAEIECPARKQINAERGKAKAALKDAEGALASVEEEHSSARKASNASAAALGEAERISDRLGQLRERVKRARPDYEAAKAAGEPEDPVVLRQRLDAAQGRLLEASQAHAVLVEARRGREATKAALERNVEERGALSGQLAVWREAAVIFGKGGAQRKVAEGALAEIEDGANEMLRACGIDLRVEVMWSREGQGLAKACEVCGAPYGSSARVKVCARCGAGRGPHLVNKLEVVLSDRSGAAEDLGGAAIQLAASAWLRNDRGSSWGAALLDEPFGQLDRPLRQAFARHLAAMLGGYGFTQAFVVAHSPDVMDSLPARIEIINEDGFATPRVVG